MVFTTRPYRVMNICRLRLYFLLAFASWDMWTCVLSFTMACALQNGEILLTDAAKRGHAEVLQALLDAGADRYAEVRMTPWSQMTAHEIILSMGYSCSSLPVYGVLHASCDDHVSC